MPRRPGLWLLCCAALALAGAGCGDGRRSVYPVSGQVFAGKDKKPAVGAMVVFHPVKEEGQVYKPNGIVDDNGRFTLTTYVQGDGAPVGEYVVTLEWAPAKKKTGMKDADGPDLLKGAYSDRNNPKLSRFTVQSGANEVPVIQLP
jgi:hypothetical protein